MEVEAKTHTYLIVNTSLSISLSLDAIGVLDGSFLENDRFWIWLFLEKLPPELKDMKKIALLLIHLNIFTFI